MKCEDVQELILEAEFASEGVEAHLAQCENCRRFLSIQQSLDERLATAYAPPGISPGFRRTIRADIRAEKRRRFLEVAGGLVAPAAGLVTSGVCALLVPQLAGLALLVGVGFSGISYIGQLMFTWLTEELGEG